MTDTGSHSTAKHTPSVIVAEADPIAAALVWQVLDHFSVTGVLAVTWADAGDALQENGTAPLILAVDLPGLEDEAMPGAVRSRPTILTVPPLLTETAPLIIGTRGAIMRPIVDVSGLRCRLGQFLGHLPRAAQRLADEAGEEVLVSLQQDLDRVVRSLEAARLEGDRTSLQAQSHILISLAGAAGMRLLVDLAQCLNRAAKTSGSDDELAALAYAMVTDVDAFRASVAAECAARGWHGP